MQTRISVGSNRSSCRENSIMDREDREDPTGATTLHNQEGNPLIPILILDLKTVEEINREMPKERVETTSLGNRRRL